MKPRELSNLGVPKSAMRAAVQAVSEASHSGLSGKALRAAVESLIANPDAYINDRWFGPLARTLIDAADAQESFTGRDATAPWRQWGEGFESEAISQMKNACRLPVAIRGALMPDAHVGYGLPIGGVLATDNAVIPYGVGMDIACRMKLTVLDMPAAALRSQRDRLAGALERETRFGVGAEFRDRRDHPVMDEDWGFCPFVRGLKDKAWSQLGTSGSGNHFVEFGELTLASDDLGLSAGKYLAMLSHSGSRGAGGMIAQHYSKLAVEVHPELPRELSQLSWLGLETNLGAEYWSAMELMGKYASANHELIHRHVAKNLGAKVLLDIENHHNFAWRELHDGREVIVHRKGATPADAGVLGIIPGSMATPGFVVRGKGVAASLNSASHGAGRRMSRKAAKEKFTWSDLKSYLADRGVELISAGLDECPMAYKDIDRVMADQEDLVEVVARFDPRLVKMAPGSERSED